MAIDLASHMTVRYIHSFAALNAGNQSTNRNAQVTIGSRRDLARHRPRFSQPSRIYRLRFDDAVHFKRLILIA